NAAPSAQKPVKGGSMTILLTSDARSLDPVKFAGRQTDSGWAQPIYDQLLYQDAATGKVTPGTALSVTPSAGATVWTIKLRPDVKFSDGTAYDAAALKAYWQRMADPANASPGR